MPPLLPLETEVIMNLPQGLQEIIDYAWPDALWIAAEVHSDTAYTIWILNLDYTYTEWTASLSLDERWTLSPTRGPWHTNETGVNEGNKQWRRIRSRHKRREGSTPT
jgi:hypothetical protein